MEKKLPSCSPAAYILVSKQMMGSPPNQSGPEQPGFFFFLRICLFRHIHQMCRNFHWLNAALPVLLLTLQTLCNDYVQVI